MPVQVPQGQTFKCMVPHLPNCPHGACRTGNCNLTAFHIAVDHSLPVRALSFLPLHANLAAGYGDVYNRPISLKFLDSEQVRFFFKQESFFGLLGVQEFCEYPSGSTLEPHARNQNGSGAGLRWTHVYTIERHGKKCSIMQSDQSYFQLYHFMGGEKMQLPQEQRNRTLLNKVRRQMRYHQKDLVEGVECTTLYRRYMRAYKKASYLTEFQGQCLDYWWTYIGQKILPHTFNRDEHWGWSHWRNCGHDHAASLVPRPGNIIKKELLEPGTMASLGVSPSGSGSKCVALPFVPVVQPFVPNPNLASVQ